ncbi:MAG: hypothetical protein ABIE84_07095 [bacterium]
MQVSCHTFAPKFVQGEVVIPRIDLVRITPQQQSRLRLLADNRDHLTRLAAGKFPNLPKEISYAADAIVNGGVRPEDWFNETDTREVFDREVAKHPEALFIIASNCGNAPLHSGEGNFDAAQGAYALAARDNEVIGSSIEDRSYFSLVFGRRRGLRIQYVNFSVLGEPINEDVAVAVSGRPLVHRGQPSSLTEVLQTSITDPRHVLLLPEVAVGDIARMPLGLRTLQHYIRKGGAAHIMGLVASNHPVTIDLARESLCCGELSPETIVKALMKYGYQQGDYQLYKDAERNYLYLRIKLNPYRHTFWAQKGLEWFIGVIGNELPAHPGSTPIDLYNRVIKSVGLTIPELQAFLVEELAVEEAVLMGNGKDPRIYISQYPHDPGQVIRLADNDIRDSITAGLIGLVV